MSGWLSDQGGWAGDLASPGPIGNVTPSTGKFTTLTTTDNVIIGTSGKGVDFSATSNSAGIVTSELFSDYEEGTWTPAGNGVTLSIAYATYTKIGNIVTVFFDITMPSTADSGAFAISGLPYQCSKSGGANIGYTTNSNAITINAGAGESLLRGYLLGGAVLVNSVYSGARIIASCTYST
jgi:hypothetical protein